MIYLEIRSSLDVTLSPALLKNAARTALRTQPAARRDLTIVLTDDEEIRTLNRDFRGLDAPTDVLAFPADETDPQTGRRYLGDVVISWPRAVQQAAEQGQAVEFEVQLLIVHGVLHLLGFDHDEPAARERMWALQEKILARLGLRYLDRT